MIEICKFEYRSPYDIYQVKTSTSKKSCSYFWYKSNLKHMKTNFFQRAFIVALIIGFTGFTAKATDGYFSTGYGTINKGLAGAGIAYYQGSLINGNPAGAVHLGTKYHIGVGLFNPNREFTVTGNPSPPPAFGLQTGTSESGSKYFVIPSLGANWMINDVSSFSVALFGNGGMNTTFPKGGFYDETPGTEYTGVDLAQMFANLTYSVMLSENHSIGVTATLGYQYFEADGLAMFGNPFTGFSSDPTKLSGNGKANSLGYGLKVGYLGKLTETLSVGATYQSQVYMSEFDEYAGLFAEQGDFDVPSSWTVGLAWEASSDLTLMADVKQIMYEDVKSVSNPFVVGQAGPTTMLGDANGPGFGWENMTIIKVGAAYSGADSWVFRGGISYGTNPIPESEVMFNILAPGVITNQISAGFTKDLGKQKRGRKNEGGKQLHLSINYALDNTVKGPNPMDPAQTLEIGMNQIELEIGFSF